MGAKARERKSDPNNPNPNFNLTASSTASSSAPPTSVVSGSDRLLRFKGKTEFAAYRVRGERAQQKQRARIYKTLEHSRDLSTALHRLGQRETMPVVLTKLSRLPWRGNFEAFQVPLNQAFSYLANGGLNPMQTGGKT